MEKIELEKIIYRASELDKIEDTRFGTLVKMDTEANKIWVDFEDNPYKKPIVAALGTPWITAEDLHQFADCVESVILSFNEGNLGKPIIRDLFYSLNELNRRKIGLSEGSKIEIEADEIVLKGRTRVTIECGDARTVYRAEGNEIIEEADQIDSSANKTNRIRGGKILLN